MTDSLKFYRDRRGKWRWRLRAMNNRIRSASSQGFATRAGARTNFIETRAAMVALRVSL